MFLALWPVASSSCLAFLMSTWGLTGQGASVSALSTLQTAPCPQNTLRSAPCSLAQAALCRGLWGALMHISESPTYSGLLHMGSSFISPPCSIH